MIIYVNGDSHSTGCEAVHSCCFLGDNSKYSSKDVPEFWKDEAVWAPYPPNLKVSYGQLVADKFNATLHCHARAAGSNDRIIRTTQEYLNEYTPDLIIIGWSTWEREEWYNDEDQTWYQVNGSGTDSVPKKWLTRYKEFVSNLSWQDKIKDAHEKIWHFHNELKSKNIQHVFFNCDLTFHPLLQLNLPVYDWGKNYIEPYSDTFSYGKYLISQGCKHTKSYHFRSNGHAKWAEFLITYLTKLL